MPQSDPCFWSLRVLVIEVFYLSIFEFHPISRLWVLLTLASSFKILVLVMLIIFGLVVDLGGARHTDGTFERIGFGWWHRLGPWGHADLGGTGSTRTFFGFWATMGTSYDWLFGFACVMYTNLRPHSLTQCSPCLVCLHGNRIGRCPWSPLDILGNPLRF
jgi:hypothetical protein